MAQITCENLAVGYDGHAVAKNINFSVKKGDYLAILGENGSGKTTLMKTLLGLIKPVGGTLVFGDGLKQTEIGYLPQQTAAQKDFPASVWEVVLSGCLPRIGLRPFFSKNEKLRAHEALHKLKIEPLRDRSYRELSGGQQQRVLLARALCATENALLLDEPVSGLDPDAQTEMYRIISDLNADGVTVMMISHNVHDVLSQANAVLHVGKETFFGSPADYAAFLAKKGAEKNG